MPFLKSYSELLINYKNKLKYFYNNTEFDSQEVHKFIEVIKELSSLKTPFMSQRISNGYKISTELYCFLAGNCSEEEYKEIINKELEKLENIIYG